MQHISLVYYTGSGHTKKLTDIVAQSIKAQKSHHVNIINTEDFSNKHWEILHNSRTILFGSPTYMGSISGKFKSFMDQTGKFWLDLPWKDKIAAGYTIASAPSGDKGLTLLQLATFAMQHGMIWVGQDHVGSMHTKDGLGINTPGSWMGLMATSSKDKSELIYQEDQRTAILFGERIAKITNMICS